MVAAALELLLDRRQSTAHPFRLRKPNQLETFSSLGLTAGTCKAEKVKRLALAATLSITSVCAVAAELDQAGLLRMQKEEEGHALPLVKMGRQGPLLSFLFFVF